jgi:hypothetical protein
VPKLIDVVQPMSTAKAPVMGSLEHSAKLNTLDRLDDDARMLYEGKTASGPTSDRGRDGDCSPPPAQIPASGTTALGSPWVGGGEALFWVGVHVPDAGQPTGC